jgi:hypothetical protein
MEHVLALALQLPVTERLRLAQQLIASVGDDMAAEFFADGSQSEEQMGSHLLHLLDDLNFSDWADNDADDTEE